jgi:hypothetical protein
MIAPAEGDAFAVRNETVYEYDSQGRVTKETFYDADAEKTEKVHDYSQVVYTPNGYVFEGSEYTLDAQSRLIRVQRQQASDDSASTPQIYEYVENGYAEKHLIYQPVNSVLTPVYYAKTARYQDGLEEAQEIIEWAEKYYRD